MAGSKRVIELQIFGQNIRIRHEDENYIQELQSFINRKVEMIQRNQRTSSTINLAARTVITLVDEYFLLFREKEEVTKEVEDKAKKLIEFIDSKGVLVEEDNFGF